MSGKSKRYIPALSFRWLTPLYDPLLKWGMRETTFKRALIAKADIQPGMKILDLGCGTGTLTVMIKQAHPTADVTGVDGDPAVLAIAHQKAAKTGVDITLDKGLAYALPYPDRTFDRVLSSLVFHHLTGENKQKAFGEILRVLKPGGELHLVDFGVQRTPLMRFLSGLVSRFEETGENLAGRLPQMMQAAGFEFVSETGVQPTIFGSISFYQARRVNVNDQQEIPQTVCGGKIKDPSRYPSAEYKGKMIFFCTEACRQAFYGAPNRFMAGEIEHPE
jgi:SAM-dependent methyltransferase